MISSINYEYIDEASIDPELICSICNSPFVDPLYTPCDHTFCRKCITECFNAGNIKCPMCRQRLASISHLPRANLTVRNMLNRIPVKCILCENMELRRGDFDEHITNVCPKVLVTCPSACIKCSWEGPRDQLKSHVGTCFFQPLRSTFIGLIAENTRLKEQIEQHESKLRLLIALLPSEYKNSSPRFCTLWKTV